MTGGDEEQADAAQNGNGGHIEELCQGGHAETFRHGLAQTPEQQRDDEHGKGGLFAERHRAEILQPPADDVQSEAGVAFRTAAQEEDLTEEEHGCQPCDAEHHAEGGPFPELYLIVQGRGDDAYDEQVWYAAHRGARAAHGGAYAARDHHGPDERMPGLGMHAFPQGDGDGREENGDGDVRHDGGKESGGHAEQDHQS